MNKTPHMKNLTRFLKAWEGSSLAIDFIVRKSKIAQITKMDTFRKMAKPAKPLKTPLTDAPESDIDT